MRKRTRNIIGGLALLAATAAATIPCVNRKFQWSKPDGTDYGYVLSTKRTLFEAPFPFVPGKHNTEPTFYDACGNPAGRIDVDFEKHEIAGYVYRSPHPHSESLFTRIWSSIFGVDDKEDAEIKGKVTYPDGSLDLFTDEEQFSHSYSDSHGLGGRMEQFEHITSGQSPILGDITHHFQTFTTSSRYISSNGYVLEITRKTADSHDGTPPQTAIALYKTDGLFRTIEDVASAQHKPQLGHRLIFALALAYADNGAIKIHYTVPNIGNRLIVDVDTQKAFWLRYGWSSTNILAGHERKWSGHDTTFPCDDRTATAIHFLLNQYAPVLRRLVTDGKSVEPK